MKIPKRWCSGFEVFTDGSKCNGCPDCKPELDWEYPEVELTAEQIAYKKRVEEQLKNWVEGRSIHNDIDNECCPDFSCCKPELLVPKHMRQLYYIANEHVKVALSYVMLRNALKLVDKEKGTNTTNVHIIGDVDNQTINN